MADRQHVALMHHDLLRVAAHGPAGRVIGLAVVGTDHVVAIVFQTFFAIRTGLAAVDDTAHADQVTDLEFADVVADGGNTAHDLVTGDAGVLGAGPFGTDLVQVGVADAAIGDVDLHIVRAGGAAGDFQMFDRLVGGVGTISVDWHGDLLSNRANKLALRKNRSGVGNLS